LHGPKIAASLVSCPHRMMVIVRPAGSAGRCARRSARASPACSVPPYAGVPLSSQLLSRSTCYSGHRMSHGIAPESTAARMRSAFEVTSSSDHGSKALSIAVRSEGGQRSVGSCRGYGDRRWSESGPRSGGQPAVVGSAGVDGARGDLLGSMDSEARQGGRSLRDGGVTGSGRRDDDVLDLGHVAPGGGGCLIR